MHKIFFKVCGMMCCMAVFMAQISASNFCVWKAYQPKVPASLLDVEDDE